MPRHAEDFGSLLRRRRWNGTAARAILKQLDASGLSVRAFGARYGIDPQRLNRWRAQLAVASGRAAAAPAFVEIRAPARATIEVALRSGHVVRVADGFAAETLQRVLAIVGGEADRC